MGKKPAVQGEMDSMQSALLFYHLDGPLIGIDDIEAISYKRTALRWKVF
jgi:hypothetical protein